jgi:D-amino-acid dehydrogenase
MAGLKEECDRMGVVFEWGWDVTSRVAHWAREANVLKTVEAARSQFSQDFSGPERKSWEPDEVVLCGGAWSPLISRELGINLPMQAGKGYSLTLPKPRELPGICSILTEARVAVTPIGDTLRFGGTMEVAGLNEDINPVRIRGIIKAASKYYPKFQPEDFANVQPWRGLRPVSPDGLPYLGRAAQFSNLSVATGHAMMGLSLGPITGKFIADIVSGQQPSLDISLLNPNRYA